MLNDGSRMWIRLSSPMPWTLAATQFGRGPTVCSDPPGQTTTVLDEKEILASNDRARFQAGSPSKTIHGHTGWRLPSVKELKDFFDAQTNAETYPYEIAGLGELGSQRFWSCNPKWDVGLKQKLLGLFEKDFSTQVVWAVSANGVLSDLGATQEESVILVRDV